MQYWKNDICLLLDKGGRYLIFLSISYVKVLMVDRNRVYIPGTSTLIAFESAGRLGNFSRAAEELQTSQSRHQPPHRQTRRASFDTGVRTVQDRGLPDRGREPSLRRRRRRARDDQRAIVEAGEASDEEHVVIACTHDEWQLVFLPRLDALQKRSARNPRYASYYTVRTAGTCRSVRMPMWCSLGGRRTLARTCSPLKEAVGPVCSPQYATANADILNGPISGWGRLTFLDFSVPDQGWASWEGLVEAAERPDPLPRFLALDSYSDVCKQRQPEQASRSAGIICVERYIEAGALVPLEEA